MPRTLLLAVAAFALAPMTPSFAQDYRNSGEVRSEVVSYADLNVNYQPDAHALVHRINRAARDVCAADNGDLFDSDARDCRVDAERRAVADTRAPLVSAEYYHRAPRVVVDDQGYVVK